MGSRWRQDGPKIAQDEPKLVARSPKTVPRWAKTAQEGPKLAPRKPKMAPKWPKMAPRLFMLGLRWPKIAPRWSKSVPRLPRMGDFGPSWGYLGVILGHLRPHLGLFLKVIVGSYSAYQTASSQCTGKRIQGGASSKIYYIFALYALKSWWAYMLVGLPI